MSAAPRLNAPSGTGAHLLWWCSEHPEYLGTGWNLPDWAGNGFQSHFQLKSSRHLSRHSQGSISQMAISQSRIKSLILNRLCLGESEGCRAYFSVRLECNYDFWGTDRINYCIYQIFWKNAICNAVGQAMVQQAQQCKFLLSEQIQQLSCLHPQPFCTVWDPPTFSKSCWN